ncbi:MAG: hypothetical protein IPJ94_18350 [Chloroflexi bacterium]|nr:hypothetical protein [Chloroflexota bacterium]
MSKKHWLIFVLLAIALVVLTVSAEDGVLFRRNISKTPEAQTEKAAIYMMDFYVPAQASTGEIKPVANYCLDEGLDDPWTDDGTCAGQKLTTPAITPSRWSRSTSMTSVEKNSPRKTYVVFKAA